MEKTELLKRILLGLSSSASIYLFIAFVNWDITWIKLLPTWSAFDRGLGGFVFIVIKVGEQVVYDL